MVIFSGGILPNLHRVVYNSSPAFAPSDFFFLVVLLGHNSAQIDCLLFISAVQETLSSSEL